MTDSGELSVVVISEEVRLVYACPHCCTGERRVTLSFPFDSDQVTRIARGLIDYPGINHACGNCGKTFLLTAGKAVQAVLRPYLTEDQSAATLLADARQLFSKAKEAADARDFAAAERQYAALGQRYGAEPDSELRLICAMGLANRALILAGGLKRYRDAIAVADGIVSEYGGPAGGDPAQQVAIALVAKATSLADLGLRGEAAVVCQQIRSAYGGHREPAMEQLVARAARLEAQVAPG